MGIVPSRETEGDSSGRLTVCRSAMGMGGELIFNIITLDYKMSLSLPAFFILTCQKM